MRSSPSGAYIVLVANTPNPRGSFTPLLVVGALALVGAGLYLNLASSDDAKAGSAGARDSAGANGLADARAASSSTSSGASRRDEDPDAPRPRVVVEPEKLELGRVTQCGEPAIGEVTLRNEGRVPAKVDGWVATCGCVAVLAEPGFMLEPGTSRTLPIRVDPTGVGGKSQRIDFRLDGNALGGRVRIDYDVYSPIRAMPSMAIRPEKGTELLLELERSTPEGEHIATPFEVLSVLPPVGQPWRAMEGEPPLEPGWGGVIVDFAAIDALAADPASRADPAFEWRGDGADARWKTFEIVIRTDDSVCGEIRVRLRNG